MKVLVWCILFTIFLKTTCSVNIPEVFAGNNNDNERSIHGDFDIKSLITGYGYPFEQYTVTTDDGYILALHRIPHGKNNAQESNKPPVFLMHCLCGTSGVYVMLGPEISLAFQLADAGYDVWLGNNRGNTYSKKHTELDPKTNVSFWDFSFHDLGYYDSTAMIDFVLKQTERSQLSYVGFSQGTTQFFAMASTRPEYNEKINIMAALAPVAYMEHLAHPILKIINKYRVEMEAVLLRNNQSEIFAHNPIVSSALSIVCRLKKFTELCSAAIFILGGFDTEELDRSTIPTLVKVFPGGSSLKQLTHYSQVINTKYFRQYDYGIIGNRKRYNSLTPPDYNISQITAPVALFYSENDLFASINDVERLSRELPNVENHLLNYKLFTHFDFVMAKDLPTILHSDLIDTLNKINSKSTTTSDTSTSKETTTSIDITTSSPDTTESHDISTSSNPPPVPGLGVTIKYSLSLFSFSMIILLFK